MIIGFGESQAARWMGRALGFMMALLFLFSSGYIGFLSSPIRKLQLFILILVLGFLTYILIGNWQTIRRDRWRLLWSATPVVAILALAPFSKFGFWGLPRVLPILLFLMAILTGPFLKGTIFRHIGLAGILYTAAIPFTYFFAESLQLFTNTWLGMERSMVFQNGIDNSNVHAFLVLLLLPFKWSLIAGLQGGKRKVLFLCLMTLDLLVTVWLRSGAYLALITLCYGLFFFYRTRWALIPFLGAAAFLMLLLDVFFLGLLTSASSLNYRLEFLTRAMPYIANNPMGVGPGTQHTIYFLGPYHNVSSIFSYADSMGLCAGGFFSCHPHFHNALFGFAFEFGWPLTSVFLAALLVTMAIKQFWHYLFFCLAASWLLIDDFSHFPAQMLLFGLWAIKDDRHWIQMNPFYSIPPKKPNIG